MISLIITYIILALVSIVIFQTAIRCVQDGNLYTEDYTMSVIGGLVWPIAYPVIVAFFVGCYLFEGISKISNYLYKEFDKGGY